MVYVSSTRELRRPPEWTHAMNDKPIRRTQYESHQRMNIMGLTENLYKKDKKRKMEITNFDILKILKLSERLYATLLVITYSVTMVNP